MWHQLSFTCTHVYPPHMYTCTRLKICFNLLLKEKLETKCPWKGPKYGIVCREEGRLCGNDDDLCLLWCKRSLIWGDTQQKHALVHCGMASETMLTLWYALLHASPYPGDAWGAGGCWWCHMLPKFPKFPRAESKYTLHIQEMKMREAKTFRGVWMGERECGNW